MRSQRRFGVVIRIVCAVCVSWCVLVGSMPQKARAEGRVSVDAFYESLAPYGRWIENPRYGQVWQPMLVGPDWRPYSRGRWVWTVEYGWLWDSDEEWGWATYHYGRWHIDEVQGWVWVPGDEWAPAWVDWRSGEGYIGWAPLPPSAVWADDHFSYDYDAFAVRYQPAWVFVTERDFVAVNLYVRCVPPTVNGMILNHTVNVTNYSSVNNVIINRSINVEHIQAVARVQIRPVSVVSAQGLQQARGLGGPGGGRGLVIFRPQITPSNDARRAIRVQRIVRVGPSQSGNARPFIAGGIGPRPGVGGSTFRPAAPIMAGRSISQPPAVIPRQPAVGQRMTSQQFIAPPLRQAPPQLETRASGLPAATARPLPGKVMASTQSPPLTVRRPPPPGGLTAQPPKMAVNQFARAPSRSGPVFGQQVKKVSVPPKAPIRAIARPKAPPPQMPQQ